ncbi:MAG: energy transducer TonB [Cyclobacteriaceae bacterium]|nr:energy transducer TonB [Cyclobacteriaceae bacterium]
MKTTKTTKQFMTILLVTVLLFSCDQKPIDPSTKLDEVLIPNGFLQTEDLSPDLKTRLDEMRLVNTDDHYYYLKLKDGPVGSEKELIFPQNELIIEYIDADWKSGEESKYHGVIVRQIKGDWTNEVFEYIDQKASPIGGKEGLSTTISENLKYPEEAKKQEIEGKVFIQFIIDKNGKVKKVQAVKGIGAGCDEEAVRVVKEHTEWIPAQIIGKDVSTRMILPITFKLD